MKRPIYTFLLTLSILAGVFLLNRHYIVHAVSAVPVKDYYRACGMDKRLLRPYTSLIIVDLKRMYKEPTYPLTAEQVNNEMLYEMLYIRKNKYSAFNAVYRDKLFYHTCDIQDYSLPYVTFENNTGGFVLGTFSVNSLTIQELVDKYYIERIYEGRVRIDKETPQLYKLEECSFCNGIVTKKDVLATRPYKFKVTEVKYQETVKQKQKVKIEVTFKNIGKLPLPSQEYVSLLLRKANGDKLIYDPSWLDLNTIGKINPNKYVLPDQTFTYTFELGPYIVPKTYKATFYLQIGSKKLKDTSVDIKFKVKDSGLKLGIISPREGDYANVRNEPNLRSKVLFKLDAGEYIIWHKQDGAWVLIETQKGHKGWVYRPFVRPL